MTSGTYPLHVKATAANLFVRIICIWHLRTIYCAAADGIVSSTFASIYGKDTRSSKVTMSYVTDRSKVGCSTACIGQNGCEGYNYRKLDVRRVECELKQGNSSLSDIQSESHWTYYQKKVPGATGPSSPVVYFLDCQDVYDSGITTSGVYQINTDPSAASPVLKDVYCNMTTDGGGWMVLLRRQDGSIDFNHTWTPYRDGFGDLNGELWFGLEAMHTVSNNGRAYQLRVDMTKFDGESAYARYDSFNITQEADNYTIYVGAYSGNATDDLGTQNGYQFTTRDRDNDIAPYNCAEKYSAGYWYKSCAPSRLTGPYGSVTFDPVIDFVTYYQGILWFHWLGINTHPAYADMKIKPI